MFAAIGAYFAKSVLLSSPLGAMLKRVPGKVWLWLLIAAVAAFVIWRTVAWHAGKIEALDRAAYGRGVTETLAAAAQLRLERERLDAAIAAELRSKNDEENRRIAADADRLRVRGPGKAACPNLAIDAGGAGGHVAAGGDTNDAGLGVPAEQRAAVPWPWLVDRAESHDSLRVEVLSWREWHRRLAAEWDKPPPK